MAITGPSFKAWSLGRDVFLLGSAGLRMAQEDPVWLGVQATRRLLPSWRARLTPKEDRTGLLAALGAFVADQPERAAELLLERGVSGRRLGDAVAARVAIQLGVPEALSPDVLATPAVQAALAQQCGGLSHAVALYEGDRGAAAVKVRSELRMLQPGYRLPVPHVLWEGPAAGSRVLHILTNSLPHTRSGYTSRTHRLLTASLDAGIAVEAATRIGYPATIGLLGAPPSDTIDGIRYHRLLPYRLAPAPEDRLEQQVRALIPLAQRFRPAVLHTTTDFTNALVTQALAEALGIPWVYEMRGQLELTWVAGRPAAYQAEAATSERVALLRAKEAELASAADAVVVLSDVQRADLASRGVAANKVLVVPNAIKEEWLQVDTEPAHARSQLGLPREGVWVGTVSSLVGYEGLDDLLRAVAQLRDRGLDVRASIAGDGVARPGLMALAADLGLTDVALFPGRVPAEDAPRWYEALDVFVVPRKDTPVCRVVTPLKPVEAMALGRPVVASDLPALAEVLDGGRGGILAPAGNVSALAEALGALAADESRRLALGAAGRAAVTDRTWGSGAANLRVLYDELRGEGKHGD